MSSLTFRRILTFGQQCGREVAEADGICVAVITPNLIGGGGWLTTLDPTEQRRGMPPTQWVRDRKEAHEIVRRNYE